MTFELLECVGCGLRAIGAGPPRVGPQNKLPQRQSAEAVETESRRVTRARRCPKPAGIVPVLPRAKSHPPCRGRFGDCVLSGRNRIDCLTVGSSTRNPAVECRRSRRACFWAGPLWSSAPERCMPVPAAIRVVQETVDVTSAGISTGTLRSTRGTAVTALLKSRDQLRPRLNAELARSSREQYTHRRMRNAEFVSD